MSKRGDKDKKSSPGREQTNQGMSTATQKQPNSKHDKQQTGMQSSDEQNKPDERGLERRRSLGWENK